MIRTSTFGPYKYPRRVWDALWNFLAQFRKPKTIQGEQRPHRWPLGGGLAYQSPYDLDIGEPIFRDIRKAQILMEMTTWSYEVVHTLQHAVTDAFSSADGDDRGWTVPKTLADRETEIDPDAYQVILDLVRRRNGPEMVIGGNFLQRALSRALGYGDAFIELVIEKEGIGRSDWGICQSLYLPTWSVRRIETPQGELRRFEQLHRPGDCEPTEIMPVKVLHFRHNQQQLYGKSLWGTESMHHWEWLKDAAIDLAIKSRSSISTRIHELPESNSGPDQKRAAENDWRLLLNQGIPTDYWPVIPGTKISRIPGSAGGIDSQVKNFLQQRYRLIPAGLPPWYYPGLDTTGAKDIATQPARMLARKRNSWCALLSEGIRWAIDIELVLKLGYDRFLELQKNGGYRIVWPLFHVEREGNIAESNEQGMQNLS